MIKRGLILILVTIFTKQWSEKQDKDWFKCLEEFDGFTNKFHKHYDDQTKQYKVKTFYENYLSLKKESKKPHDFKIGINYFTDVTWEEFQRDYLMHVDIPKELEDFKIKFPESFHYISELPEFHEKDLQKVNEKFENFSSNFWEDDKKKCSHHRFLQDFLWNRHHQPSYYQTYNNNQSYPINSRYRYDRSHTPYSSTPTRSYGYSPTQANSYNHQSHSHQAHSHNRPYSSHRSEQRYNHGNHSNYNNNYSTQTHQRYTPTNHSYEHDKKRHHHHKKKRVDPILSNYPKRKTWEHNASPIKNQKKCAACYAFAALAAVELQAQRHGHSYQPLSEQEIIDCNYKNSGCTGGSPFKVFNYINNHGISYNNNYPFKGSKNPRCRKIMEGRRFKHKIEYFFVRNPIELIVALNKGPAVVIQHVNKNFKRYTGGIFDDKTCNGMINHAALAVGYDISGPVPYIKVKNEWGTGWGMGGYYKISLGELTRSSQGICGMFSHSGTVVPTITH